MKDSEVNKILKWLEEIRVDIADDPFTAGGPRYISKKLAEIHGYLEPLTNYQMQVMLELRRCENQLMIAQREFEFEIAEKLANDPDVRVQKSLRDREALAKSMLKHLVEKIEDLRQEQHSLEQFLRIIRLKSTNLNRANRDIRLQERAIYTELKLSGSAPNTLPDEPSEFRGAYEVVKMKDEDFPEDLFEEWEEKEPDSVKKEPESVKKVPKKPLEAKKIEPKKIAEPKPTKNKVEVREPEIPQKLSDAEEKDLDSEIKTTLTGDLDSVLAEDSEEPKSEEKKVSVDDEEIDIDQLFGST